MSLNEGHKARACSKQVLSQMASSLRVHFRFCGELVCEVANSSFSSSVVAEAVREKARSLATSAASGTRPRVAQATQRGRKEPGCSVHMRSVFHRSEVEPIQPEANDRCSSAEISRDRHEQPDREGASGNDVPSTSGRNRRSHFPCAH